MMTINIRSRAIRSSSRCCAIAVLLLTRSISYGARTVVVLFTGFSGSSGTAGLDTLNTSLQQKFGGEPANPFSSQVFGHSEQQQAFNFINQFNDVCDIVLVGHSLGGDSVIELADDYLRPAGRTVGLTIQIDSVGIGDEVLPANVTRGINYYQISDPNDPLEPQGATFVQGATNINVEVLFNDTTITHTSIDDDPRLHARILSDIRAKRAVPAVPVWAGNALAGLLVVGGVFVFGKRKREAECR